MHAAELGHQHPRLHELASHEAGVYHQQVRLLPEARLVHKLRHAGVEVTAQLVYGPGIVAGVVHGEGASVIAVGAGSHGASARQAREPNPNSADTNMWRYLIAFPLFMEGKVYGRGL